MMNAPCLVSQAAVAAAAGAAALTAVRLGASPDAVADAVAAAVHSVWRWASPLAQPHAGPAEECEVDHVGVWLADDGPDAGPRNVEEPDAQAEAMQVAASRDFLPEEAETVKDQSMTALEAEIAKDESVCEPLAGAEAVPLMGKRFCVEEAVFVQVAASHEFLPNAEAGFAKDESLYVLEAEFLTDESVCEPLPDMESLPDAEAGIVEDEFLCESLRDAEAETVKDVSMSVLEAEDLTDESVRETLPGAEAASLMGEPVEAVSLYESLRDAATRRLFVEAAPESAAAAGGELGGGNLCSRPRTLREQHSDVSDVSTAASRTNIAGSFERKGRDALEGAEDDSTLAPWSLPRPPENRLQEGVVRGGDTQVSSDSRSSAAAVALARVMAQADSEWSTTKPSWVPQFREKVQELIAAGDADGQRQTTSLIQELLDLSRDGTL